MHLCLEHSLPTITKVSKRFFQQSTRNRLKHIRQSNSIVVKPKHRRTKRKRLSIQTSGRCQSYSTRCRFELTKCRRVEGRNVLSHNDQANLNDADHSAGQDAEVQDRGGRARPVIKRWKELSMRLHNNKNSATS